MHAEYLNMSNDGRPSAGFQFHRCAPQYASKIYLYAKLNSGDPREFDLDLSERLRASSRKLHGKNPIKLFEITTSPQNSSKKRPKNVV